jgi:hypothetical protein
MTRQNSFNPILLSPRDEKPTTGLSNKLSKQQRNNLSPSSTWFCDKQPLIAPGNGYFETVLRIRIGIRIRWIHMFLGLSDPDPDPLVTGMDPDMDPALDPDPDPSIIMQ